MKYLTETVVWDLVIDSKDNFSNRFTRISQLFVLSLN